MPDSSYTGANTKAGQQMLLKVKPAGATIPAGDMPDHVSYNNAKRANIRGKRPRFESF